MNVNTPHSPDPATYACFHKRARLLARFSPRWHKHLPFGDGLYHLFVVIWGIWPRSSWPSHGVVRWENHRTIAGAFSSEVADYRIVCTRWYRAIYIPSYSIIFHHMPSYSIYLSSLPTFLSIDLSISLSIYASFVDAYVVGWFPAWIQLVFRVGSIWMDEQNGMVWSKPIRMDNWAASCIGDAAGCKICSVLIYNECAWKKYPTIYRSKSSQNICYIYIFIYLSICALPIEKWDLQMPCFPKSNPENLHLLVAATVRFLCAVLLYFSRWTLVPLGRDTGADEVPSTGKVSWSAGSLYTAHIDVETL